MGDIQLLVAAVGALQQPAVAAPAVDEREEQDRAFVCVT